MSYFLKNVHQTPAPAGNYTSTSNSDWGCARDSQLTGSLTNNHSLVSTTGKARVRITASHVTVELLLDCHTDSFTGSCDVLCFDASMFSRCVFTLIKPPGCVTVTGRPGSSPYSPQPSPSLSLSSLPCRVFSSINFLFPSLSLLSCYWVSLVDKDNPPHVDSLVLVFSLGL